MTDEGTLIELDGQPTLRFERRLDAPLDRVWRAVTDPDEMRAWFPAAVLGDRAVGAPLRFPFDANVDIDFEGRVTAWEPMRVFAFEWNGDELRLELTERDGATDLVFTHRLPDRSSAPRTASGWHTCLADLRKVFGGPAVPDDLWKTEYLRYLERMGPPLGEPNADGSMSWTRTHFHAPDDIRDAFAAVADDDATIEAEKGETVSTFTVTVPDVDPVKAARWHTRLLELDMRLSTGQPFTVERDFTADYEKLLA
jgi:uncharacterized protein YndB with AHSA1/START domain